MRYEHDYADRLIQRAEQKIVNLYDQGIKAGIKEPIIIMYEQLDGDVRIYGHDREKIVEEFSDRLNLPQSKPGSFWVLVIIDSDTVVQMQMKIANENRPN